MNTITKNDISLGQLNNVNLSTDYSGTEKIVSAFNSVIDNANSLSIKLDNAITEIPNIFISVDNIDHELSDFRINILESKDDFPENPLSSELYLIKQTEYDADNKRIMNVAAPQNTTDAANKSYVDARLTTCLSGISLPSNPDVEGLSIVLGKILSRLGGTTEI